MTDNLKVDPADLAKASAGINGVIDGLADTGVGSDYSAAIGRGYGDLDLDDEDEFERHAREMSYPPRLVTAARDAADTVMAMVRDGAAPFDGSRETWLAKL